MMIPSKTATRFAVLFFIVFHLGFAFYSRNLRQWNRESLFLSQEALTRYEEFRDQFPEKKVVLVHLTFPVGWDEALYQETLGVLQRFQIFYQEKYPRLESEEESGEEMGRSIEFVHFEDIYRPALKGSGFEGIQRFLERYPSFLQFPFVGKESFAFLILFQPDFPSFEMNGVIEDLKRDPFLKKYSLKMAGLPYVNYLLDYFSEDIKIKVFPLMFFMAFLLIFYFTRSLLVAVLIFIPSLGSLVFTMGLIQYIFGSMNMITSILPLLIFVINLCLGFHLFFSAQEQKSLDQAFREKAQPLFLMVTTTAIGFGSLYFNAIEVIRQFALLAVISIFGTTLFTLFWFFFTLKEGVLKGFSGNFRWKAGKGFFRYSFSFRGIVLLCFVAVFGSLWGGAQLRVVTDSREYFPHSSGVVVAMDKIQEEFLGTPLFEIVFFKKGRETFSYEDFQKMRHYEQEIEDQFQKRYQKSYQLLSSNRFVQEANALYAGTFELPQFKESYFSLLSGVKPSIRALYPTQGVYRISLLGNTMSAGLYFEELKGLREILSTCSYEWSVNGLYYNLMYTQELLIRILAWSFLSSLGVISFLAFLFFRSIKIFFIFLLVNLIPLLLTLLFMYCFHLSINIATVMTFSIALGMIVDSTFHLTYIFQEKIPFEVYYQTTYIPILMSSFLLVVSFGLFGFHGFLPIRHFGLTLSFTIVLGALFDLYVLPTLLTGKTDRCV